MQKKFKKMLGQTETYVFLIIVLLALMIQVRSGQFFTGNNIVVACEHAHGHYHGQRQQQSQGFLSK